MKKLLIMVFLATASVFLLFLLALVYIDMSGHVWYEYELKDNGGITKAYVKIDRYVTEDKIVYRSAYRADDSYGYSRVRKEIFLKKDAVKFLRSREEALGQRGLKRLVIADIRPDGMDYLFYEHPRFFVLNKFPVATDSLEFSPEGAVSYMPLMEMYNYWKKGTQYFHVIIPFKDPLAPLMGSIAVRYDDESYITVLGKKVEADRFILTGEYIEDITLYMSRYTHKPLMIVFNDGGKYVLTGVTEDPVERIRKFAHKVYGVIDGVRNSLYLSSDMTEKNFSPAPATLYIEKAVHSRRPYGAQKDIYFDSFNRVLSGRAWYPDKLEKYGAFFFIPDDGPVPLGEEEMIKAMAAELNSAGYAFFTYDGPGRGKSQGSIGGMDDKKKLQDIRSFIRFMMKDPKIDQARMCIAGYKGGGYLAVRSVDGEEYAGRCIVLGLPEATPLGSSVTVSDVKEMIGKYMSRDPIIRGDAVVGSNVPDGTLAFFDQLGRTEGGVMFFKAMNMPVSEFRNILQRDFIGAVEALPGPVLIVTGRNDINFTPGFLSQIEKAAKLNNPDSKVAVCRDISDYLGKYNEHNGRRYFELDKDVVLLVRNWVTSGEAARGE
ncbi:MAG: hypothetical protein PHH49_03280 [Candidatus Omnitrophica bacterium]|nr:hypothetical protein [Candidatus Omnitrophota bacterium]MDD5487970.1 hypothetical protein [Candidatus Omnitrophota bacterium]